jgi:hypothetical protein
MALSRKKALNVNVCLFYKGIPAEVNKVLKGTRKNGETHNK